MKGERQNKTIYNVVRLSKQLSKQVGIFFVIYIVLVRMRAPINDIGCFLYINRPSVYITLPVGFFHICSEIIELFG